MNDKESERIYPVRTFHEFIFEIQKEWGKFKRGAQISISIFILVFVVFILVFIRTVLSGFELSDVILELLLAGFLIYGIYLMNFQYRFFKRWEKRITRLTNLEENLMPQEPEDTA